MGVTSAVASGRDAAARRMRDTCTIRRIASVEADPTTGEDVVTYADPPVYVGKCRYKAAAGVTSTRDGDAGGRTFVWSTPELHIPVGAADVHVGDVVECDAAADDPYLQGRPARVAAPMHGSQLTAYRMQLEAG